MSSHASALEDGASSNDSLPADAFLNFQPDTTITGPTLDVTATTNYQPDTISDVSAITFEATANSTATFKSTQFSVSGIAADTTITGDAHADTIAVNVAAGKTFNGSELQFSDWSANDRFDINASGDHATITGTSANDIINMGAFFDSTDAVNGGGGANTLKLDGEYSSYVDITGTMLSNVGTIDLAGGFDYSLNLQSSFVAPGNKMTINASGVGSGHSVSLNLANDTTDGYTIDLGAASNSVDFSATTTTINCTGGANSLAAYGVMAAGDKITGTGNIDLSLYGDYSAGYTFGARQIGDVGAIYLNSGYSYKLTVTNPDVHAGEYLVVNGADVDSSHSFIFNGTGVTTSAAFDIFGGQGSNVLNGGAGNDEFQFVDGALLTATDRINGEGGSDNTLTLGGNYSTALKFQNATIQNIQQIYLDHDDSYDLQLANGNVASGQTLQIDGGSLGSGDALTVNGASIANGTLIIDAGAGHDILTGGSQINNFDFDGADLLTAADRITGGSNYTDSIVGLNGNYSAGLVFQNATIKNIGEITLEAGNSYNLTFASGNVASGQTMTVYSYVSSGDSMTLNASHLIAGTTLNVEMNSGTNDVTGGAGANNFYMLDPGTDMLTAGARTNLFDFQQVGDSTSTGYSTLVDFNPSNCTLRMDNGLHAPGAINAEVTSGSLSTATFDSDLATAINSSHLGAYDAVVFTPNAGTLAGDTFLIIDENGTAGYQAGADMVIELSHAANLSALSTSNFET